MDGSDAIHPRIPSVISVAVAASVFVVVDSAYGLVLSMRDRSVPTTLLLFLGLQLTNFATLGVLRWITGRFEFENALFFSLLLSLVVTLYDRYRPYYERRQHRDRHTEPAGSAA